MKQKLFEDQHQAEWESFAWRLELLEKPRRKIPAEPAYDGLAVAYDRIYLPSKDGTMICWETK